MKILLLGEYSNVHWGLAEGLRALGHNVTVVSDGDSWKNYRRDIDLRRRSLGKIDTLRYLYDIRHILPKLRDYDVVQLINPVFLDLRAERILPYYKQLRKQNGRVFLGSLGIDKPWVEEGVKPETLRYSDFYLFGKRRHNFFTDEMEATWLHGAKGDLFDYIADDCDGIIAGLYEMYVCCRVKYSHKLTYIPFPVALPSHPSPLTYNLSPLKFFIGIQSTRSEYKGTDIMLKALERLQAEYADRMQVVRVEDVPFHEYQQLLDNSHVLLDQLYSYTPAMNGLLAMSKGLVLVGGGEEEHYQLLGEKELRPIINVQPTEEDVVHQIESRLLSHPDDIRQLSLDSIEYIRRHHDPILVAQRYIDTWQQ